jgi:hypothetical protein
MLKHEHVDSTLWSAEQRNFACAMMQECLHQASQGTAEGAQQEEHLKRGRRRFIIGDKSLQQQGVSFVQTYGGGPRSSAAFEQLGPCTCSYYHFLKVVGCE